MYSRQHHREFITKEEFSIIFVNHHHWQKFRSQKKFLHGQPVYTCTCTCIQCVHFVYTHVHEHSTLGVCTCVCYIHVHYETRPHIHVHLTLLLCLHPLLVSRRAFVALDLLNVDSFLSFILFKVGLFVFIGQFPPFLTNQLSDLCIQIHVNRLYIQMYIYMYTCTCTWQCFVQNHNNMSRSTVGTQYYYEGEIVQSVYYIII